VSDCETFNCGKSIAQADAQFKLLKEYVVGEAQSEEACAVERRVFRDCMKLGLYLMGAYFEKKRGALCHDLGTVGLGPRMRCFCWTWCPEKATPLVSACGTRVKTILSPLFARLVFISRTIPMKDCFVGHAIREKNASCNSIYDNEFPPPANKSYEMCELWHGICAVPNKVVCVGILSVR
jgi:hypothetical protein